jgi:hypothetical protein
MFGWMFHPKELVSKRVLNKQNNRIIDILSGLMKMSDKLDKHKIQELRQMVKEKDPKQSTEELLTIFCSRHGLSSGTCKYYYNILVESGDIKEK